MSLDAEILAFIRRHLATVWALEVLLLLRRDPDRAWTVRDLIAELRASDSVVSGVLDDFGRTGLIATGEDGLIRYSPSGAVTPVLCGEIERVYRERPVAVIKAISAPQDRVQGLADAFRFKGDKP